LRKDKGSRFEVGDWIVHHYHGIGRIEAIVEKGLADKGKLYYQVVTKDMKYWLPIEDEDSKHVEAIRTKAEFEEAIKVFTTTPKPIAKHYKARKKRIHKRWQNGDLLSRAKLIRDLHGRNIIQKLSFNERETLETLKTFFIEEWLVADPNLSKDKAAARMNDLLSLGLDKIVEPQE
jgi:RNA polymerase-interacting CarD/CdnL/TRCF family regulator